MIVFNSAEELLDGEMFLGQMLGSSFQTSSQLAEEELGMRGGFTTQFA